MEWVKTLFHLTNPQELNHLRIIILRITPFRVILFRRIDGKTVSPAKGTPRCFHALVTKMVTYFATDFVPLEQSFGKEGLFPL